MQEVCLMEPHDIRFYETKIRDYIPDTIIDVHTHMHLKKYYLGMGDKEAEKIFYLNAKDLLEI